MADYDASQLTRDELLKQLAADGADLSWFGNGNGNVSGEGYKPVTEEDRRTKWSDYPKAVATGVTSAVSNAGAGVEYLTDGQYGTDLRKAGEAATKSISDTISPAGQHAMNASFLPGEGDDSAYKEGILRTVGMQGAASIFSLASAIIPGTLAGKIALRMGASAATAGAVGAGVARGSAALQNAGGSAEQIHSALDGMTDAQLQESPVYRQMREQGMSEQEARSRLYQKVDGIAPVLNGALTFMLAAPEASAAKAGVTGAAKRQGVKGAAKVAGQEAGEELVENATQEATSEQALTDASLGNGLDPYKIAGQAITGAVTGAALGSGTGLYTHGFVSPDQKAAIDASLGTSAQPPQQAVPVPTLTTSAAPVAPSSGGQPTVPEKPVTLDMQIEQLTAGKRDAMLVPLGNPAQVPTPPGMERIETSEGAVIYNPNRLGKEAVLSAAIDGRIGDLTGYVQTKTEAGPGAATVVSRNAQGVEQDAALVSPDRVAEQAAVFAGRAQPGSTVGVEPTEQVIADRLGETQAPPAIADAMRRVAPQEDIGDAGLNRVPAPADEDLIRYDDGTTRRADEPAPLRRNPPPLWPEADKFNVSPEDQQAADEYYAERNAEPLEGPAQDDDFEPWQDFAPLTRSENVSAKSENFNTSPEEDTSEVTPKGIGPKGVKALGGTTAASKRTSRRGKAAVIAKKSQEARYAALQNPEPEKAPTTPFRDRLQKTIAAIEGLKRKPTRQEQEKLEWAKRRLAGRTKKEKPQGWIGPEQLKAIAGGEQKPKGESHEADDIQRAKEKLARAAKKAFDENLIVEEEKVEPDQPSLLSKRKVDPRDISTEYTRQRLKQRLKKMVGAVEKSGGPLPPNISKNMPEHVLYAMAARTAIGALDVDSNKARDYVASFLAADFAARQGDFSLLKGIKYDTGEATRSTVRTENNPEAEAAINEAADDTDEQASVPDEKENRREAFHMALVNEVERQMEAKGSINYGELYEVAKKADPKLAAKLDFNSPDTINSWMQREKARAARRKGASKEKKETTEKSAPVRTVQVSDEEKARLLQELERAGQEKKPDAVPTYEEFIASLDREAEAQTPEQKQRDVDAAARGLQKAAEQKVAERTAESRMAELRERIAGLTQAAAALVKKNPSSPALRTMKRDIDSMRQELSALENRTKNGSAQTSLDDIKKRVRALREVVAKASLTKDGRERALAAEREIVRLQAEAEKLHKQSAPKSTSTFAPMLSQGVFSEVEQTEQEAEGLRHEFSRDYDEGMAQEAVNPSVYQMGGETYLQGRNGPVPVSQTTTVEEVLDRGFRYGKTNPRLTEFVHALIRKNAANVPVHVVSLADLQNLLPGSDGYYHPAGYIVLPYELTKQDPEIYNQVVVHEALHAALADKLNQNPVALAQVHALAEYLKKVAGIDQNAYLWKNAHEFLSEVFSRGELQEKLRQTALTPELARMLGVKEWRNKSVWRAVLEKIADWLGYRGPMNALEGAIAVVERIDTRNVAANQETAEYTRNGWPHPNEKIGSFQLLASRGVLSRENVTNGVTDALDTAGSKNRKYQLTFKTLDQIRQTFKGYFNDSKGNALDAAIAAIQKMGPYAAKRREASDKLAQRFLDLKPDVADELATLLVDTTVANVQLGDGATNDHLKGWHSWQGKLALPGLTARYNQLKAKSPEAAKLYNDMKTYFRDMQNEMARSLIAADLADAEVTPPNLDKFIDRVIQNKLTEADKELFKSKPTALKNILDAAQARVVKGDYFPLMRHGHHVVVTINEIKDTMGGVEGKKGEVEFRGKTFKQAQAKAEAFAKKMYADGMTVISVTPTPVSTDSDYGVVVKVQRLGFHTFESEMEARKWRRENAAEFDQISEVQSGLETGLNPADLTIAQRNRIFNAIKRQAGISDEMKDAMGDVFQQVAAGMMSGNRIQQRSIARRRVKGASKDYGRILIQYGEAATNNLARTKFMPEYREAHDRMSALAKDTMSKNAPVLVDVMNEVARRFDTGVEKPSEPPKWMQTAMSLTFLGRLASPMHSVINGMQVGMVTYPVLAAKFKAARAGQALLEAYNAVGVGDQVLAGLRNTLTAGKGLTKVSLDLEDTAESIKRNVATQKDGAELTELIDMLQERGAMATAGFELAQSISRGVGKAGMIIGQLDRAARQLPSAVEDINRSVSAIAAYRLARANGMTAEQAREYAFDVVMNTQGDYSGVNAPRFFNNNYFRPALQFKKYAQMMTTLLLDAGYKATKGATKEEKMEARRFLMNIVGVQIATAGALSLPGIELVKAGFMIAALFGGAGWDDEEEHLIKLAEDTFGADWGRMLTKGVISRAANIDLSQKVSLSDMWTPLGEPETYDANGIGAYLAKGLFGAPYSSVSDFRTGIEDAGKGDWLKGIGKVVPVKIIGDAFKAAGAYSEGKATATEVGMNVLGLRSGRQAEEGRKVGTAIRESRQHAEEYRDLAHEYLKAQNAGERAKVRARIVAHNKQVPLRYRVFPNALDRVRNRIDAERVN